MRDRTGYRCAALAATAFSPSPASVYEFPETGEGEKREGQGDIKLVQRDNDRQTHNDWMEESFRLLVRERERERE